MFNPENLPVSSPHYPPGFEDEGAQIGTRLRRKTKREEERDSDKEREWEMEIMDHALGNPDPFEQL